MHNSLFIRDILRRANTHAAVRERRDPHRTVCVDPAATARRGEFRLDGPWGVESACGDADGVLADDVRDFLTRMGVRVSDGAVKRVRLGFDTRLADRDCRLAFSRDGIRLTGGSVAGVWAGIAWMEWEMRCRRAPILPVGEFTRRAAWGAQIHQGPWGANYSVPDFSPEYLPDEAFALYPHYGVNRMMIYGDLLCYARSRALPELDCPDYDRNIAMLSDAAKRAARYGVRFCYVPVGPKLRPDHPVFLAHPGARGAGVFTRDRKAVLHFLCSSSPETLAFYRETFSNLYRAVPEMGETVLITYSESFYHCRMWEWKMPHPCPRCAKTTAKRMLSGFVGSVLRGVEDAGSDAQVAMWIYSWLEKKVGERGRYFRAQRPRVGVFHHIEKDHRFHKKGYTKSIWDYSIDFTGPTEEARSLSRLAHEAGRPLFIKTETAIGLETFQFPYIPAMQHLSDKWQAVRRLRPDGVHQSWLFYGMCGTRAEELGLWAAYRRDMAQGEFLRRIAERDFGPEAAGRVIAAWERVGRAVRHLPCLCLPMYYVGPSFAGPAHPLVPTKDAPIPDVFHAFLFYLQEGEETFSVRQIKEARVPLVMSSLHDTARPVGVAPDDAASDGWDIVVAEYAQAAAECRAAYDELRSARGLCRTTADRRNLAEELRIVDLFGRTNTTCENTVRFLRARRALEAGGDESALREMRRVARVERRNAAGARPIYRAAPWLDLPMRIDGVYSSCVEVIDEKIRWIDRFLKGR